MSSETHSQSLTKSPISSNIFSKYPFQLSMLFVREYMLSHCSPVRLCATPGSVALQAPLSMGFSRQEIEVGCLVLLQGIFPTQELNPGLLCLLHCRQVLYHSRHLVPNFRILPSCPRWLCSCSLLYRTAKMLCSFNIFVGNLSRLTFSVP